MEVLLAFLDATLRPNKQKKITHMNNTGLALKVYEHQSGDKIP